MTFFSCRGPRPLGSVKESQPSPTSILLSGSRFSLHKWKLGFVVTFGILNQNHQVQLRLAFQSPLFPLQMCDTAAGSLSLAHEKMQTSQAVVAHAFNPHMAVDSRPAWSRACSKTAKATQRNYVSKAINTLLHSRNTQSKHSMLSSATQSWMLV